MTAPKELAKKIIASFDPRSSRKIGEALAEILQREGFGKYEAYIEADRLSLPVLSVLKETRLEELPFDFGLSDPMRLVGKARKRKSDTQETILVRELWRFSGQVLDAIYERDKSCFEILCAICLKLSGAREAYALCSRDEGGIDLFGRIPIGHELPGVVSGIVETNLLRGNILFLGQCKRYNPVSEVGPGEIRDFIGAVNDCLRQYEGNLKPPSHRVPKSYYGRGEPCIPIFMTTADYSEKSKTLAQSNQIKLINGKHISEFICSRKVGFVLEGDSYQFDKNLFYSWLQQKSDEADYRKALEIARAEGRPAS